MQHYPLSSSPASPSVLYQILLCLVWGHRIPGCRSLGWIATTLSYGSLFSSLLYHITSVFKVIVFVIAFFCHLSDPITPVWCVDAVMRPLILLRLVIYLFSVFMVFFEWQVKVYNASLGESAKDDVVAIYGPNGDLDNGCCAIPCAFRVFALPKLVWPNFESQIYR